MGNKSKKNLYSLLSGYCLGRNRGHFMPHGFSIERVLLTVFLIVLVISIILPLIPRRPHRYRYAYVVKQKAYFKSFDTALEIFKSELVDYPPSDALDELKRPYCGAMKLCEAVVGQDFEGFHPNSKFRRDRTDDSGNSLYDSNTLKVRKGPYLPLETANAYRLKDLYNNVGPFDGNNYVLCDVFRNIKHIETGKRVGMPTLYYEANTAKSTHDINDPNNPENIYNYRDNHALLALGVPGKPGKKHPLFENPKIFYEMTKDYKDTTQSKPNNAQTFILLSAGKDGLYGTGDDVANFEIEWKPK